ncbi:MAG: hypothetical protein NC409_00300 [Clostridium sp.]|nr:hypothetical protein [Clostridium sp.]
MTKQDHPHDMEISGMQESDGVWTPAVCSFYPPGEECAQCGGRCCKEHGCVLAPEDLLRALARRVKQGKTQATARHGDAQATAQDGNAQAAAQQGNAQAMAQQGNVQADEQAAVQVDEASVTALLTDEKTGMYAIEYVSTPQGACFYLRMRHKCYTFIGVDAMGECAALGDHGCLLSVEERPKGGRMLKSSPDRHCVQHYTVGQMCADWQPYQELLLSIYRKWHARMTDDGTFDRCDEAYFAWLAEKGRAAEL